MNVFRRLPTKKLLTMVALAVLGAGTVTAVAVAALGGSGPVPPRKSLASAISDALHGPPVAGVTATISFTNNLIDASALQSASPLLKGASGRLWATGDGRLRLELQSKRGDTEISVTPTSFSLYDTASNTVYEGSLAAHASQTPHDSGGSHQAPTLKSIQDELAKLMDHVTLSGANPTDVGGQPAYRVDISPKHSGGLLGSAQLAWDSTHGLPLRVAVYATGSGSPVLELAATSVTFGAVSDGDLTVSPAPGAKIVRVAAPKPRTGAKPHSHVKTTSGLAAVSAALPFKLDAPSQLAGLPQTAVRLLDWGSQKAALVTYGHQLGAILVVERPAGAKHAAPPSGSRDNQLPTIAVNGASATEIPTALGTLLRFERGGVSYIVVGSVPPAAAEAAARGL